MIKKLICKIFFHDLEVIKDYKHSQKLYCRRCKRYFGINHDAKAFIPWDKELDYHMKIYENPELLTKEVE